MMITLGVIFYANISVTASNDGSFHPTPRCGVRCRAERPKRRMNVGKGSRHTDEREVKMSCEFIFNGMKNWCGASLFIQEFESGVYSQLSALSTANWCPLKSYRLEVAESRVEMWLRRLSYLCRANISPPRASLTSADENPPYQSLIT